MRSRRTGTLLATVLAAAALVLTAAPAVAAAPAAPAAEPGVSAVNFAGTVALSNCSGSLVRTPTSGANDPALVLSNGHCLEGGFLDPGEVVVNRSSRRTFTLLNASAQSVGTLRASKIAYATMTDTDISVYQLTLTYAQIQSRYGIAPLDIVASRPVAGTDISVVSGYWKRMYNCSIDGFAYRLREGSWTWKDSVRYTPECQVIGGTSGSPVVDVATGDVVAVNNTLNEDGARCTLNNPCEVDQNGTVTVREGIGYAQETYWITACVKAGNVIDLTLPGCVLPRP